MAQPWRLFRNAPRRWMTAALLAPWLLHVSARAADPPDAPSEQLAAELLTPVAEQCVTRGLNFLAAQQQEDGSFGAGTYGRNVAVSALAGMAFMSAGSTPGRGPYGQEVLRCLDYVLSNMQDSGFIVVSGSSSHGPMYGHGFATLFLSECYGMAPEREDLREKLSKAVDLIVQTQNREGGWRYQPQRRDADISVTICQVMALRAARNAGLHVPHETIDQCIDYVRKSQNPDGGFMYMIQGGASAFPRSAAGVVALYSAGVYEGPEIEKGLNYLLQHLPRGGFRRESHYYYGQYYAVQAMWHAGGKFWAEWFPAIRDELVKLQRPEGAWDDTISREYGTAMACIILQIPNNYLPIFQR